MSMFDFFKKESNQSQYTIVERELDPGVFRQGIKLHSSKFCDMIVTVSPKVSIREVDGLLQLSFNFIVEANPKNIEYDSIELRNHIGEILLDIMQKDYNKNEKRGDYPVSIDEGF